MAGHGALLERRALDERRRELRGPGDRRPDATTEVLRTRDGGWYRPNLALLEQLYPGKGQQAAEFVGDAWVVDTEHGVTEANCDLAGLVTSLSTT